MKLKNLISWLRFRKKPPQKPVDDYLTKVSGVIHIGANTGQERKLYQSLDLHIIWIEPIPDVFAKLEANIKKIKTQRAFQALVADVDGKEFEFHIASNNGASSSIMNFKQHKDIWPTVTSTGSIFLKSTTLAGLFKKENINSDEYQAMVIDTQGSELLVLQGAVPMLKNIRYIKVEVADFESYEGCCQLDDIVSFMKQHNFKEISRSKFANHPDGGSYFDIIYEKI